MLEDEDDRDFSPVGNMVPRFDRSYKPKPAPPSHTPSSIASSGSRQLVSSQQEAEWERNLARLRDFQGIESSSRRCLTGLKNLGNTCYMNSILQVPTVQFSNLADFYVYLALILLSKINLYHRFKLWSRSARFSDDLQI